MCHLQLKVRLPGRVWELGGGGGVRVRVEGGLVEARAGCGQVGEGNCQRGGGGGAG